MQIHVNNHDGDRVDSTRTPEAVTPAAQPQPPPTESPAVPVEVSPEHPSPKEIAALRAKAKERDELWDRLLRTQADFENWRKRLERESRASVRFALQEFVQELLPVLDNLQRALKAAEESRDLPPFLEGMRLVHTQFFDILRNNDVIPIESVGQKFDPGVHEAVSVVRTGAHPPFTVVEEVAKGFRMHDRVIRPARVVVSAAAEEQPSKDQAGEGAEER